MALPEDVEELLIRNYCRIKVDLDGLSVVTKAVIGRILSCSSCVADACPDDPGYTPEPGVWSPESTQSKGGRPDLCRNSRVDRRYFPMGNRCVFLHWEDAPFSRLEIKKGYGNKAQGKSTHGDVCDNRS